MSEITVTIIESAGAVSVAIYCADEIADRLGRLMEKVRKLSRQVKGDQRTE